MPRHGTLRGVGLTALGAVVVAGSFVALGLRPDGIASYYRDTLTPAGFAIWFCGFVAATLAPPAIAVLCWFGAMRFRYGGDRRRTRLNSRHYWAYRVASF